MQRSRLFLAILFGIGTVSGYGQAPPAPPAPPSLPGTWTPAPLVQFNAPDPETGGAFRTLGDAWLLSDGTTVFWARYGEKDKGGWALYAVKDGPPRVVLKADEDFTAPDGVKKRYRLFDFGSTLGTNDLHVGRHVLFMALQPGINQESVYGVLGGSLTRLIGRGDTLTLGGPAAPLKRVAIEGMTTAGAALLHYWTEKPAEREGWLLHDGQRASLIWNRGAAVPGESAPVVIDAVVSGPEQFGDTTLVILDTRGDGNKRIFYRLTAGRAERLLVQGELGPVAAGAKIPYFREIRAAAGDRFLVGVNTSQLLFNRSRGFFAWQNDWRTRLVPMAWWQHVKGSWREVINGRGGPSAPKNMTGPVADSVHYLRAGSDSVLIAAAHLSLGAGDQVIKRIPGFWLWDGNFLTKLALPGNSTDLAELSEQARKGGRILNSFGVYPLPGAGGGLVADVPGLLGGMKVMRPGAAGLVEPLRFALSGATWPVSEADIVGWVDERTVVVRRQALGVVLGYFRLVRQ